MRSIPGSRAGQLPTFLAPMEGITHPGFRELVSRRGGVTVVCTEFIRITESPPSARLLRRQFAHASASALSVQVMGNHLSHLAQATSLAADAGADLVDLNVGCPAPRVVRKGVGSALLRDHELLGRVVAAMRAGTRGWLSAKVRAGFDSADSAVQLARVIEDAGADLIAVHARRRVDFFEGVSDWRVIRSIKRAVSIPVIGNGDVWCARDAQRMRTETGCDGVMVGRGALRNPWLFAQLAALEAGADVYQPNGDDVLAHLSELATLFGMQPDAVALGPLKEHLRYLCRAVPESGDLLKRALQASSCGALLDIAAARLGGLSSDALDLGVQSRFERSGSAREGEPQGPASTLNTVPSTNEMT
jgi:tRNA-dihydrouridine synthase B